MATTGGEATAGGVRARLSQIRDIEREQGAPAAEAALVAYLREGPAAQSPQAFVALSRVLMKNRKLEDAARAAQKACALAPLEADPRIAVGLANLRLERNGEAAAAFAEAIRLDPTSARAHLGAAAVKMAAEDYEDALQLCDRVLDFDPDMERAHELMARINLRMGRTDRAIAELRGIVERNPENRRVLRAYLGLMRKENRQGEVIEFLEQSAAADPNDRRRQNLLSRVAAQAGRADLATERFERLAEQGELRLADKVRFAATLIQAGEIERARGVIASFGPQRALKPVAIKLEGDIAFQGGRFDDAVSHYEAACRAARVPALEASGEGGDATPEARARAWRAHAQGSILQAFRERRQATA